MQVGPRSRIDWRGSPRQEELFLHEGSLTCKVDRGVGKFMVASDFGTVSVKGTEFSVTIAEPKGDEKMLGKRMLVKVLAGAVIASTAWTSMALAGGDEAALPQGGTVTGVVAEKGDAWIRLNAEDGKSERYTAQWVGGQDGGLDKEMIAKIGKTPVGSKVKIVWKQEEKPRVLSLTVLEASKDAAPKDGPPGDAANRERVAKQQARVAELKQVVEKAKEDLANLRQRKEAGGEVGADALEGAERRLAEATAKLQAANRELESSRTSNAARQNQIAQLEEQVAASKAHAAKAEATLKELQGAESPASEDQLAEAKARLVRAQDKLKEAQAQLEKARAVQAAREGGRDRPHDGAPAGDALSGDEGSMVGTVAEKGQDWISVKPVNGPDAKPVRFVPKWVGGGPSDGGGYSKDMLELIAGVKVGQRVQVRWVRDERLRIVKLTVSAETPTE